MAVDRRSGGYRPDRAAGWVLAGLLLAGLLLAASCGSDRAAPPSGPPEEIVRAAPDKTLVTGRARLAVASEESFIEGTLDLATGRARGRLRSPRVPDAAGQPVELDYVAAYIGGQSPTGDPAAASAAPAQLLAGGVQAGNPIAALDLLRGAVQADPYGGAAVRGASTFRYDVLINPERALAEAPEPRRAALSAALGAAAGPIPARAWVDHRGLVRRVELGNVLTGATTPTDDRGLRLVTSIDLYDFGLPEGGSQ